MAGEALVGSLVGGVGAFVAVRAVLKKRRPKPLLRWRFLNSPERAMVAWAGWRRGWFRITLPHGQFATWELRSAKRSVDYLWLQQAKDAAEGWRS